MLLVNQIPDGAQEDEKNSLLCVSIYYLLKSLLHSERIEMA
jgi:hypothetical protein